MGDGFWSDAEVGQYHGIPGEGCWYREHAEAEAFWVTGGVHKLYERLGYEGGILGLPTSNFDSERGVQTFQKGVIYWDGHEFASAGLEQVVDSRPFDMPRPPTPPA